MATGLVTDTPSLILDPITNLTSESKPIEQILHLQQVIRLPGAEDGAISTSLSEKATFTTKRPARKQPPGLKMRFRPIGFGSGDTGKIGSSSPSAEGSSTQSDSDEEMEDASPTFHKPASISESSNDDSDAEMVDTPTMSPKQVTKSPKIKDALSRSALKRKHGEGNEVKNSSSRSETDTNDRELKNQKKNERQSQKSMTGSQSASTETAKTNSKKHSTPASSKYISPHSSTSNARGSNHTALLSQSPAPTPTAKVTPILPPKRLPSSPPVTQSSPIKAASQLYMGTVGGSLEQEINPIDPDLTAEESKREIKRLKKEARAKRKESGSLGEAAPFHVPAPLSFAPKLKDDKKKKRRKDNYTDNL